MDLGRHRLNGSHSPDPRPPQAGRRGVRRRARSQPERPTVSPAVPKTEDIHRPLVPVDGLVFTVAGDIGNSGIVERQFTVASPWADRIEEAFRPAFVATWQHIPKDDRALLLTYWRQEPPYRPEGRRGGPSCPRPLIRIDVGEGIQRGMVECCGRILSFPASLLEGDSHRLRSAIARTLAATYRFATREFWALYLSMVDEPLERWQRRRKKPVTDAENDRKALPLEMAYRVQVAASIDGILGRWGLQAP